jgi:DNA-directed RNA polymerase subunit RPC12/RpoP
MQTSKTLVSAQNTKLRIGFGIWIAGGVMMWFHSAIFGDAGWGEGVGALVALVGGAWLALAIRCPKCRLKLFWHAVTKKGLNEWSPWLHDVKVCPQCGYRSDT